MNETTENFLNVFNSFEWPEPKPVFYRLYYNESGMPVCYTMEDLEGNYIDIDAETYVRGSHNVRVIDGKLIYTETQTSLKLIPGDTGTACHINNVSIVVAPNQPHKKWSRRSYDTQS